MSDVYRFQEGSRALLMSVPHVGTLVPEDIAPRLSEAGLRLPDTDWYLDRLYDFASAHGASILQARYSRYVVDLNRPPDDTNLYPGADTTALVPLTTFAREPVYALDPPGEAEVGARRERYWSPYHARLAAELARLREAHGAVVLFDCHSIRSHVPRFFAGALPDFNLGTAQGASCAPALREWLAEVLAEASDYTLAVDGRFTGGYITRHYGDPDQRVHAFQLELSQATYMDEDHAHAYREDLAARVRPHLERMLEAALAWVDAQ